jgi:N-acetylglucosaminyldiphosphoundecaprenol N-acetyl-beta-D-mannosaminyltransferase
VRNDLQVLGTKLLVTDYQELGDLCLQWTRESHPVALDFANTQIVTMRRHEGQFRELTAAYDFFPPDGMPLVWCLNKAGARLKDRVYGPTFMRKFLETIPAGYTHYLLGGSAEVGEKIRKIFTGRNPGVSFVGSYQGRCLPDGRLDPAEEARVLTELKTLSPDFIWVGFGTPKQQAWITRYKPLLTRGVLLTVGFAFDVNAGTKPDAPSFLQKLGLTWVFRLWSEPRRLGPRYLKYNFLFLWYLFWDALCGKKTIQP